MEPAVRRAAGVALGAAAIAVPLFAQAPPSPTPSPSPVADKISLEEIKTRERLALIAISTIVQAEKAYAAVNSTFFDEIRCLTAPAQCIPNYPDTEAPFLDPGYPWLDAKLGYARKFHPGPKAPAEQVARGRASPTSLTAFAFTVSPMVPGRTGGRAFCGDSGGRMCMRLDGREPPVKDGRCDPCLKLQ